MRHPAVSTCSHCGFAAAVALSRFGARSAAPAQSAPPHGKTCRSQHRAATVAPPPRRRRRNVKARANLANAVFRGAQFPSPDSRLAPPPAVVDPPCFAPNPPRQGPPPWLQGTVYLPPPQPRATRHSLRRHHRCVSRAPGFAPRMLHAPAAPRTLLYRGAPFPPFRHLGAKSKPARDVVRNKNHAGMPSGRILCAQPHHTMHPSRGASSCPA